ncbi:MAG: site-specific DNA-methyltransferase [Mediterranea sp.]|jgi:adenine-specific DNA-methyltransferase|nr:site-specific DNA-methyltransferase [Mediterranea sp.]
MNKEEKLSMRTPDLTERNYEALAQLFPNAVTETVDADGRVVRAIDADVLRQEINAHVVEGKEERYQFTWPDKRKSVLLANAPLAAALRPCREESADFDTTENLYIEGDNLDVLKLLRETYLGKVKMIYIDPPYNTGNDFVYNDDFAEDRNEYLSRDHQYDEEGNRMVKNLDSNGRFHTDWLNMIYPRLRVARDLLREDGVIFISIDDNEVQNLRKVCDEVFGEENFVAQFIWERRVTRENRKAVSTRCEYILCFTKSSTEQDIGLLSMNEDAIERYKNPDNDPRGIWTSVPAIAQAGHATKNQFYTLITPAGRELLPPSGSCWRFTHEKMQEAIDDNRIWFGIDGNGVPRIKKFLNEGKQGLTPETLLSANTVGTNDTAKRETVNLFEGMALFETPKPVSLLTHLINISNANNDSLILDFFSGSATTAHAVMQLNAEDGGHRKHIMVQLPELTDENSEAHKAGYANICEIGKERIRRAAAKIKAEKRAKADKDGLFADHTDTQDYGFRVLKLDSSNMKDVYYTPGELVQMGFDLEGFADNIKADRSGEDLLFQAMLELNIPLSARIREEDGIFYVDDNYLIACFRQVDMETLTAIAKRKPYYAVFRDSSFVNDSAMVNFEQVFKTYSPDTRRRVL